jgi:hypothetical protein
MSLISRIKMAFAGLLGIALLAGVPAHAAGTIPLAMAQQIDVNGQPLANCFVRFFVAGTVASPQNSYSDFGLTLNPNSVLRCDQAGRVPMFWLADGLIHVQLTDSNGTPVIDTTMQVLGPSSGGGGGGGTVDPTTVAQTGDLKPRYGTGLISGWVRGNGLTIGNATSGATERANADTQNAFVYLYNADPNLVVSGGRTGNALNDYNANKTIALPDFRGRVVAALDDMGNVAAGRRTVSYTGVNATVLGSVATHGESHALTLPQLPTGITSVNAAQAISVASTANLIQNAVIISYVNNAGGGTFVFNSSPTNSPATSTGNNSISVTSNNTNGDAHSVVDPTIFITVYLKL